MYADPWSKFYWIAIIAPILLLIVRLRGETPLRLPPKAWLFWFTAAASTLVASAYLSPYRGSCLLWSALPLAGWATFLLLYDWLRAAPGNLARLACFQAWVFGALILTSCAYWFSALSLLTREQFFSKSLFEGRNAHPLGHANYTAGLVLLGLPWLVQASIRQRGLVRAVWIGTTALAILTLFASGSRGGLLGLGTLGISALLSRKLGWKKFTALTALTITAASLLAVANPRIRAMLGPQDPLAVPNISTVQRTAMLQGGFAMLAERPLLGWGPHSTPLAYPRFRHELEGGAENVLQLHSTPLEILANAGTIGFVVSAALLILAFRGSSRAPVAAISLAGYGVFSLTDYQLDVPVFALAIAALAAQLAPSHHATISSRTRATLTAAVLTVAAVIITAGRGDPTPTLNTEALLLARDPAKSGQAVALLNQSLSLNPDQEIAHFNLGWLLLVPDPASAETHFRKAAQLVPDKGGVYFGIGLAQLNQGNRKGAARAFALECLNEPPFLVSPWWNVPAIAAERANTIVAFTRLAEIARHSNLTTGWALKQAGLMATLAPRLGMASSGTEKNYRRTRLGYPVLMRNLNIEPPVDLYDVREDPHFSESVNFALPPKGWLPSPLLLKLLDDPSPEDQ